MSSVIVIVGSGVIGLTIAYQLVTERNYPPSKITILASDFPSTGLLKAEYTSSKSGAHFRPFPSKSLEELRDSEFSRSTYNRFKTLAVTNPESSIKWVTGSDYIEYKDTLYETLAPGYTYGIEDFRVIPKEQLPEKIRFGASYKTWVMNAPIYLDFLENSLRFKYGVHFELKTIKSLREVSKSFPNAIIFNCSGNGLLFDGELDPESYSVRGQTLLLRAPQGCHILEKTITYQLKGGLWIFVIPRPLNGGVILGGTKQIGDSNSKASSQDTQKLIELGKIYFPELLIDGEFDIRRINVGFRPARIGGAKISKYTSPTGNEIIDCYGFAGSGMEMSWGAGERAIQLCFEKGITSRL